MAQTVWTPNQTQKDFMALVAQHENGITIFELKMLGHDFKTGSINILITKGLVEIVGDREFPCEVVYNGVVVGHTTKSGKIFKIVA